MARKIGQTREYMSIDGDEFIKAKTMFKMSADAEAGLRGWQFTWTADRTSVTVDWGDGTTQTYTLQP